MIIWALINDRGNIIAITEEHADVVEYLIVRRFPDSYFITEITNKNIIEKLLIEYDNLYLEHDELMDFIGTRDEQKIIDGILREESSRLSMVIKDLSFIKNNYDLDREDIDTLRRTLHILKEIDKPKKFRKIFRLKDVFDMIFRTSINVVKKIESNKHLFLFFRKD